eukprot:1787691-Pyramimonas_sp.AAC.1
MVSDTAWIVHPGTIAALRKCESFDIGRFRLGSPPRRYTANLLWGKTMGNRMKNLSLSSPY